MAAAPAQLSSPRRDDAPQVSCWPRNIIRELRITQLCTAFTAATMLPGMYGLVALVASRIGAGRYALAATDLLFAIAVLFLMWGALFYLITRWAFFKRVLNHRPPSRDQLEKVYEQERPRPLAILVPSFKEELRVVKMTLMSAALSEYPDRRVVLLIDDPPNPASAEDARNLAATRALVRELNSMLRARARRYASELAAFERRLALGKVSPAVEMRRLAKLYREVAGWLEAQADSYEVRDHYDDLYVKRVLREPARAHAARAREFRADASRANCGKWEPARFHREYRRLATLFAAPLSSFERKRYVNQTHTPNKAMNLNAYIGLFGRNFREVIRGGALHLEQCDDEHAEFRVPDVDYIITLDADSMLLSDYALQLTHIMDRPESDRVAVVQTPFSAVQGSPGLLERIAGAQTDIQWLNTQGSTWFNSSFWVGANALLRRAALEDICEVVEERGYPIRRYIHDRTLVEDTESTIDLVVRGWQVYCYPERLSYSATPPDFGALVIQRRRWANGPLLIVPKLLRYAFGGTDRLRRMPESLIRLNALTSARAAAATLLTVALPFPDPNRLPVFWLIVSAIPYYFAHCRDLEACGYDWWDLPRLYGMNLLLTTVNLTGVFKSIRQAITGVRSAFARTPKIPGRTAAPASQIIMPVLILPCVLFSCVRIITHHGWAYGAYGMLNFMCLLYAFHKFIGLRAAYEDIAASIALRFGWIPARLGQPREVLPMQPAFAGSGNEERVSARAN
jgi:cellulose synthase (UDP-forming)